MYIFLWVVFVVLWFPAGAVAYRFTRFLGSIEYNKDRVGGRTRHSQDKLARNTAILCGYYSFVLTALIIIFLLIVVVVVYGKKFLIGLAGE